jgi:hypothetical protein
MQAIQNCNGPHSAQLLAAWERGLIQTPAQRALTLLSASFDGTPFDSLASLTIGECDKRLLRLHERVFGSRINAIANCPACDETLELNFNVADICVEQTALAPPKLTIEKEDYIVTFRLPQTLDLMALDQDADVIENRRRLLDRCILSARLGTEEIKVDKLPNDIVEEVSAQMAKADPQAEILIAARCPHCAHQWKVPLDIGAFVWAELNAWAPRVLREVHLLAEAYGWSESDILALSPTRRRLYLEMLER